MGGFQKKSKKNMNCSNPKFYETLRFNLSKGFFKGESVEDFSNEFLTI